MSRLFGFIFLSILITTSVFCDDYVYTDDKYELLYKDGRSGGYIERVNTDSVNIRSIFSVDLRHDENFIKAIDNSILFYSNVIDSGASFKYGEESYTPLEMIHSLVVFKDLIAKELNYSDFLSELADRFDIYKSKNMQSSATLTGYYTPHIEASTKKSSLYPYPIVVTQDGKKTPIFFTKNKNDLYDLTLEGAGIIELEDGRDVTIEYAGKKHFSSFVKVPNKKKIAKLKSAKKSTRVALIKKEVVQVVPYFRITTGGPYGWADLPLTPKYTAAIDRDLAPMGGLMYIKSTENFENADSVLTSHPSFKDFEGFMLAQDIGSAIKGSGRIDIYCGDNPYARHYANSIARKGEVYLIVVKKDVIDGKIYRRVELR